VDQNPIRLGKLPAAWNPASPSRVVAHVQWNAMCDGADAGMDTCTVCFQQGKDVQIATPEGNVCGPVCGYRRASPAACGPPRGADAGTRLQPRGAGGDFGVGA